MANAARYTCSESRSVRPARRVAAPVSMPLTDAAWPLCAVVADWFCPAAGAASSLLSSPQAAPRTDSMARAATAVFARLVLNTCMVCFPLTLFVRLGGRLGDGDDAGHRRWMDGAEERVFTGLGEGELEGLSFGDVPGVEPAVRFRGGRSTGLFHRAGRHRVRGHVVMPPRDRARRRRASTSVGVKAINLIVMVGPPAGASATDDAVPVAEVWGASASESVSSPEPHATPAKTSSAAQAPSWMALRFMLEVPCWEAAPRRVQGRHPRGLRNRPVKRMTAMPNAATSSGPATTTSLRRLRDLLGANR